MLYPLKVLDVYNAHSVGSILFTSHGKGGWTQQPFSTVDNENEAAEISIHI